MFIVKNTLICMQLCLSVYDIQIIFWMHKIALDLLINNIQTREMKMNRKLAFFAYFFALIENERGIF